MSLNVHDFAFRNIFLLFGWFLVCFYAELLKVMLNDIDFFTQSHLCKFWSIVVKAKCWMCCECIQMIFPISTCCHNPVALSPIMLQQAQYCTIIKANNVCLTFSTMFHCFFVPQIIAFIVCHRLCKCWSRILDLLITGILYESVYGDTDLPSTWRAVCKTESVLRWVVYVDSAALYIAQILISTPPLAMM